MPKAKAAPKEVRVVFQQGVAHVPPGHAEELGKLAAQWVSAKVTCRKHDRRVLGNDVWLGFSTDQTAIVCTPCCVRSESDVRTALRQLETVIASRLQDVAPPATNAIGADTAGEDEGLVHVHHATSPGAKVDVPGLPRASSAYLRKKTTCPNHDDLIVGIRTVTSRTSVTQIYTPCCAVGRAALLKAKEKLEATSDAMLRGAPVKLPDGTYLVATPPAPPGPGMHNVSADVAARYAHMGRLPHVVRGDDGSVEVVDKESDPAAARDPAAPWPPPCTDENVRAYSRKPIAAATERPLKEGRPLSDYAILYDWDEQVVNVQPADDLRALFVKAGDCPKLIEELDGNSGETILLFLFAENRYRCTVRSTARGYMVGEGGTA